jgi:alanine dehydrogenase
MHRRASCDAGVVSPSNAWRPSVRRPYNGHYTVPRAPGVVQRTSSVNMGSEFSTERP